MPKGCRQEMLKFSEMTESETKSSPRSRMFLKLTPRMVDYLHLEEAETFMNQQLVKDQRLVYKRRCCELRDPISLGQQLSTNNELVILLSYLFISQISPHGLSLAFPMSMGAVFVFRTWSICYLNSKTPSSTCFSQLN